MKVIAEICCGSYYDCVQAETGGASRVELNSALHLGGLTPSLGALRLTKQNTKLKVITMIRPRAAGFCYSDDDFAVMIEDLHLMMLNGADGAAFGCLTEAGSIDIEKCSKICSIIQSYGQQKEIVFHRAFDCCENPFEAIETLIKLGVHRLLTSGKKAKAIEAVDLLKELQHNYGNQIEILAGSGMNAENVKLLVDQTQIRQVHSSCKEYLIDPTTTIGEVKFGYHALNDYETVSAQKVKEFIAACDSV